MGEAALRVRPRGARPRPRRRAVRRRARAGGRRAGGRGEDPARGRGGGGRHRRRARRCSRRELAELGLVSPNGHVPVSDTGTGLRLRRSGRCGPGSRRSTSSRSSCSSRSRCASSRRGSWSTSSSTPTWRAASRDTGHFLIRGVARELRLRLPAAALARVRALRLDARRLPVGARRQRARRCARSSSRRTCSRAASSRPGCALAAAALAVAIPPMIYIGTLMTENAFYPRLHVARVRARARARAADAASGSSSCSALCALAFLTRAQAVALVAAVLDGAAPARLDRARAPAPARASGSRSTAIVGAGALLVGRRRGRARPLAVGRSSAATASRRRARSYTLWPSLRWIVYHVAALDLSLFVLPFAALIVLVANARHLDRPLRVFCAAAVAARRLAHVEVAVFASTLVAADRGAESLLRRAALPDRALRVDRARAAAPAARGRRGGARRGRAARRRSRSSALMNINAQSDTPFIQPWWYLGDRFAGLEQRVAARRRAPRWCSAAVFLWLPRRYAPVLPALVALGFFLTWLPLQLWIHSASRALSVGRATPRASAPRRDWIDTAVGRNADVDALSTRGDNPYRASGRTSSGTAASSRVYDFGAPLVAGGGRRRRSRVQRRRARSSIPRGKPMRGGTCSRTRAPDRRRRRSP